MGSRRSRKRRQINAFLDVLAACSDKPIATNRRDLLAEIEAEEAVEDMQLQERRSIYIP